MDIRFEFKSGEVINGVSVYANGVYVGDLLNLAQDNLLNWCCIQPEKGDVEFALRNEDTFEAVLTAITTYIDENNYGGLVISNYSGGIAIYFDDKFWNNHGFWQSENAPSNLYFYKEKK